MPAYPRRTPTVFLTALGLTLALAACSNASGDSGDDPPSLPPSAPAATQAPAQTIELTPEEEQAVEEAKAKFDEFMEAYVYEATTGEPLDTGAGPVIGGHPLEHAEFPLRQEIQIELVENYDEGHVAKGDLRWTFLGVEDVDLDRMVNDKNVPAVWLRYCIDQTDWQMVNAETGDPVTEPGDRQIAVFRAIWYDDDGGARTARWLIAEREWTGEPC
jgi:hypothetical protein